MFIFGLMTISNVRKTQSRLQPETLTMNARNGHESTITNMRNPLQRKKSDRHLLIMLFIQVLLILLFTLPLSAYKLYSTLTRNVLKSTLQNTIENFMFNIFLLALYVSCGMPFYIYTLSGGRVFRKALFSLMEALRRKMMHILH
ncbi:unnamed protein product [Adineta steineri]|nr:unnamed protein product [Adineta steineri]